MHRGTWIGRKIKIPCTRVHGFVEKTKNHVPSGVNAVSRNVGGFEATPLGLVTENIWGLLFNFTSGK